MSKFLRLTRVCVPLSLDCDLSCRYCYRNVGRIPKVPEFNDLMKEFLAQLDPKRVQALVASGGEPLLHWDKVKELYSYAPPNIHKKVMTNGLNLTEEIVDYLNEHDVEVWVSHDGDATEWLRGVDVLKDDHLRSLILKIKNLTFNACCTTRNPDPYKVYEEIKAKVQRKFYFHFAAVFADTFCDYLTEDFDYDAFQRGSLLCELERLDWKNPIPRYGKGMGINVLPNGDVVGMAEIHHKYGTVLDSVDSIIQKQIEFGDRTSCANTDCTIFNFCNKSATPRSNHSRTAHSCEVLKRRIEIKSAIAGNTEDD